MYQRYFGLQDSPFSIAPDPRFLYLSERHREALAHLLYGVGDHGGFVVLTGEVGTGKTTVCRCLLQQLPPEVDIAFIVNPKQSAVELLQSILAELGVDAATASTIKPLVDRLNERLLASHAQGRNTILIIDEAQNLSAEVLEQLRLLTNLETHDRKLLQLILLGQPELNDLLRSHELRQLAQRVTARYHLQALSRSEVGAYVRHRLLVAGCRSELFTPGALRQVTRLTGGVPRLINLLCDRALLGAYAGSARQVTAGVVRRAAREVLPPPPRRLHGFGWRGAGLLGGLALLVFGAGAAWQFAGDPDTAPHWLEAAETDATQARRQLFALWQIPGLDCEQALQSHLHCHEVDDRESLLAWQRPALVTLGHNGQSAYGLLLSQQRGRLTLQVGPQRITLSERAFSRLWQGEALLLSPLPQVDGGAEEWLLQRLEARLDAAPAWRWRMGHLRSAAIAAAAPYPQQHFARLVPDDAATRRARIEQFQHQEKLPVSGSLDAATRAHLLSLLEAEGPRLSTTLES